MKKVFRDWQTLIKEQKPGSICVVADALGELLDYVDTLESALDAARREFQNIAIYNDAAAAIRGNAIVLEALDKGK